MNLPSINAQPAKHHEHLEALIDDLRAFSFQAGANGDDNNDAMFTASDAIRDFVADLAASLPDSPVRAQLISKRELEQIAHNGRLATHIQALQRQLGESTPAARAVLTERQRQISGEGWKPEHDDQHTDGSLARAAGCYAIYAGDQGLKGAPAWWPWIAAWWKPGPPRRMLEKAGALILAEIERLDRAEARERRQ